MTKENKIMPKFSDMIESKYLTKDDINPERIVTIKSFVVEEVQSDDNKQNQAWIMYVNEFQKGVRLNTGHKTTLDEIFNGATSEETVGRQIILWNNPSVEYKGKVTGGIRIRSYNVLPRTNDTSSSIDPHIPGHQYDNRGNPT